MMKRLFIIPLIALMAAACTKEDISVSGHENIPMRLYSNAVDSGTSSSAGSAVFLFWDFGDIINNTAYCNSQKFDDGNWAEIFSNQCRNVNIVNNIMYAKDGGCCNTVPVNPDSEIYENNLYFNGEVRVMGINGKVADPKFVAPTTESLNSDFHLLEGSPAIGAGTFKEYMPETDRDGISREGRIDAGAYQYVE